MRDFSKISPSVWRSQRFTELPTDDARYLYLYLLTCEHQTNAGAYHLPHGYACDDLRWEKLRLSQALEKLVASGLILHDATTAEIAITRWFKHNPPMSESHLLGVERTIERIHSSVIAEAVLNELHEAWELFQAKKADGEARKAAKQKTASTLPGRLSNTVYLNGTGKAA
jgi:hypothetical protein